MASGPLWIQDEIDLLDNVLDENQLHRIRVANALAPAQLIDRFAELLFYCIGIPISDEVLAEIRSSPASIRCCVEADDRSTAGRGDVRRTGVGADDEFGTIDKSEQLLKAGRADQIGNRSRDARLDSLSVFLFQTGRAARQNDPRGIFFDEE